MKHFDMQEYLKNPTRPIVTRDGRAARVLCTDRISDTWPVVALVRDEEGEEVRTFHENGECYLIDESPDPCDLFFAPERHEAWINMYEFNGKRCVSAKLYNSREDAMKDLLNMKCSTAVAPIKIEWEE